LTEVSVIQNSVSVQSVPVMTRCSVCCPLVLMQA